MTTIYKLKATYDYKYGDDEWYEDEETLTITADSQEEAEEMATDEIGDNYSAIRDLVFEVVQAAEIPPGTIVLKRNLISNCGRYRSDGYIMIEKELGFTPEAEEDNPFTNPFEGYENKLGQPLGEYALRNQNAVFEAGLVSADFVQRLNEIGVVICSVTCSQWPDPFALAKDGSYVGVVMPIHVGWARHDPLLDEAERLAFIEAQRESGGVFNQTS